MPEEQGDIMRFLANTEKINGLVEDLHEALMGYQVCMPDYSLYTTSNICARLHYKRISMMRVVGLL